MKILITGGAGFIGSHLVEALQDGSEVIVVDNFRTGKPANLAGLNCQLVEGSILDRELLDRIMEGVNVVFHLAALVSVPESMKKPLETIETNLHGLVQVLEAAKKNQVQKLCFASSAAVYGEDPEQPKREEMVPAPLSPYAVTKLAGEHFCGLYTREGVLQTASLRFFNVFGPRQDPRSGYAAAVPLFLERALSGQPLCIFGDGGQTRDFVYVKDIVGALVFLAKNQEATGVFNVGYGQVTTILEMANEIIRLTRSSSGVCFQEPRTGDIRHSSSDPGKLMRLGWEPRYDVASGLQETARHGGFSPA